MKTLKNTCIRKMLLKTTTYAVLIVCKKHRCIKFLNKNKDLRVYNTAQYAQIVRNSLLKSRTYVKITNAIPFPKIHTLIHTYNIYIVVVVVVSIGIVWYCFWGKLLFLLRNYVHYSFNFLVLRGVAKL